MLDRTIGSKGGETTSIHTKKSEIQRACLANLCATLLPSLFTWEQSNWLKKLALNLIYSINKPFEDKKEMLLVNAVANTNESHRDKNPKFDANANAVKDSNASISKAVCICGNFLDIEAKIMPLLSRITTPCCVYLGSLSDVYYWSERSHNYYISKCNMFF